MKLVIRMSQQEQIYVTCYQILYTIVVKDRTKDNYDLVRTEHLISFVVLKNVMPLFRVVLKMTLPKL